MAMRNLQRFSKHHMAMPWTKGSKRVFMPTILGRLPSAEQRLAVSTRNRGAAPDAARSVFPTEFPSSLGHLRHDVMPPSGNSLPGSLQGLLNPVLVGMFG